MHTGTAEAGLGAGPGRTGASFAPRGQPEASRNGPVCRPPLCLARVESLTAYRRGGQICSPGRIADPVHRVVSGAAKAVTLLSNGRQQTVDLLLVGDYFAFDNRSADTLAVEAVAEGTVIAAYRRRDIVSLADQHAEIGPFLVDVAFATATRLRRRMMTLSHPRTTQKVGAFLLEMTERLPDATAGAMTLPVSRYDIADYLGLSMESVSRALSKLKRRRVIGMPTPRRVTILDRAALDI